jgi:MFS family permease
MTTASTARLGIVALLGEGFLSRLSFGILGFAMPLYARSLGMSMAEIGLLISVNTAVTMLLKPAMGTLADRWGLRRSLIAGVALRSLTTLLFAFSWAPWHLFATRAVHGMSQSMRSPPVNALLAEYGGRKSVASVFAWYSTAKQVAASAGRAIAGVLITFTAGKYAPVFVVAFVMSALPLALVWLFVKPAPPSAKGDTPAAAPAPATPRTGRARPAGLMSIVTLGAMMSGTAAMLRGLFPILATEYGGLTEAQTGLIYLGSTVVTLAGGPLFGWISDRVSRDAVLLVRGASNIFSSAIYLFAPGLAGIAAAKLVDDAGKAAFRPAWGAMMATASEHDTGNRARNMAVMSLGEDIGEFAGPALAGLLLASGGLVALMGVRIGLAALTEAYAIFVSRRLEAQANAQIAAGSPSTATRLAGATPP